MELRLDDGVQFGLGLFETIAVSNGTPVLLSYHLERLRHSMDDLGIVQSVTEETIQSYLKGRDCSHHALKVMVSEKNCIVTLRPNPYTKERYQAGFRMEYSSVYRNETSSLTRHKTMNYGDCILEKRRAAAMGIDELVFCNSKGELCETTASNLFFRSGSTVYTPPVSCGLLPGVLRRYLMERFPVTETILHPEDVAQMEECFVTNSLMGIMPVRSLGNVDFFSHTAAQHCMAQYQADQKILIP